MEHTKPVPTPPDSWTFNNLPKWQCLRCSHEWIPRTDAVPKRCPNCKDPYWREPLRRPKSRQAHGRRLLEHQAANLLLDLYLVYKSDWPIGVGEYLHHHEHELRRIYTGLLEPEEPANA